METGDEFRIDQNFHHFYCINEYEDEYDESCNMFLICFFSKHVKIIKTKNK